MTRRLRLIFRGTGKKRRRSIYGADDGFQKSSSFEFVRRYLSNRSGRAGAAPGLVMGRRR